jgi:chemotaxis response regulator CheB
VGSAVIDPAKGESMDGLETAKDTVQVLTESAASHIGRIAVIITGAVRDVAREVGDWATDAFEMRDAAKRAQSDDTV